MLKPHNRFMAYQTMINVGIDSVNSTAYNEAYKTLSDTVRIKGSKIPVFVFGNGGSAAIAEHFTCDYMKGVGHDTHLSPVSISLGSNVSVLTAIANDFGYEHVFSRQLQYMATPDSVGIGVSASGNSPNVINGLKAIKSISNRPSIALVGFDGGQILKENLADIILHVNVNNYGVVEDCHQIIFHSLAQTLRVSYSNPNAVLKL